MRKNMKDEILILSGAMTELAESKTYIELTTRVCFYDAPNLNGVRMLSADAAERAQTLVNMPVVAKYRKNALGQPDLGGHECYKDPVTGEISFGTENIGTHVSIEVKDDQVNINGELLTLPCLFATARIWKRNKNVVAAIRRLYAEKKLFNSWEILYSAYLFEDGIKTLTDYLFESNCLLGTGHHPAGGTSATAIELSSVFDAQLMVAEALESDLVHAPKEEEMKTNQTEDNTQEELAAVADTVTETPAAPPSENETASLTDHDLREKLRKACRAQLGRWCWPSFVFPMDKTVWVEAEGRESELDYILFTFEIGEGDVITLSEPTNVKLAISVTELNTAIVAKDEALVQANGKINELTATITALTPYKEAAEKAEQERIEAETKAKRTEFAEMLLKTKLFTAEELTSAEHIKAMVESLDDAAAKSEIAERFMQSLEKSAVKEENLQHETAELTAQIDLHSEAFDDTSAFMRSFLGR